ncbi:MAG: hypothetical protein ACRDNG_15110 [Gaiellaceae bacterium]
MALGRRARLTVWDVPERARVFGVFLDAVVAAGATAPEEISVGPSFFRFSEEQEFAGLLRSQGLGSIEVSTIAFSYAVPSADDLWRGLLGGTVRTSALIFRQSEDVQRQIRAAFDRIVEEYQVGDRLDSPPSSPSSTRRRPSRFWRRRRSPPPSASGSGR